MHSKCLPVWFSLFCPYENSAKLSYCHGTWYLSWTKFIFPVMAIHAWIENKSHAPFEVRAGVGLCRATPVQFHSEYLIFCEHRCCLELCRSLDQPWTWWSVWLILTANGRRNHGLGTHAFLVVCWADAAPCWQVVFLPLPPECWRAMRIMERLGSHGRHGTPEGDG